MVLAGVLSIYFTSETHSRSEADDPVRESYTDFHLRMPNGLSAGGLILAGVAITRIRSGKARRSA